MNKRLISDHVMLRIAIAMVAGTIVSFGIWIGVILVRMGRTAPLPSIDDYGHALTPPVGIAVAVCLAVYGTFYFAFQRREEDDY